MKRAVYAGSFDPLTNGHLWMIKQASELFDEVVIAIGVNPDKKCTFSLKDRMSQIADVIENDYPNVIVSSFENEYLVNYAKRISAQYIIRGIRSQIDFEYEKQMRNANTEIAPEVHTIFLIPPRELADVSSSFVKGLIGPNGWEKLVPQYVPEAVAGKLLAKFGEKEDTIKEQSLFKIQALYANCNNAYHNAEHINHCMTEYEEVKDKLKDPEAVRLALIYHDCVYDPTREDNEEKSYEKFIHFNPDHPYRHKILKLIMVTKKHEVTEALFPDWDYWYMCDIDFAIFGVSPAEYYKYRTQIRLEYSFVSDELFRLGRKKFLEKFVSSKIDRIYFTDYFTDKYQKQAKENILKELEDLK